MTDLFNTNAAADFLNAAVPGESASYWNQRLVNARRSDRQQPFAIPFSTVGKACFYEQSDLEQFAEFEKSRRLGKVKLSGRAAEALRAFGGFPQGRPFKGGSAYLLPSETPGGTLVRATINEPLTVFAMTPEQAIEFGKELIDVGKVAQRHNGMQIAPAAPSFTSTTLVDNADMVVQRREYEK
jgi:hypothetical protein